MTMGSTVEREAGVLKLVHPGGYVETHRTPVATSDVMNRYPQYFVTRPDVFKFPWLVVRPESILMPGHVFYMVPWHTLRRLVRKSRLPPRQALPLINSGFAMFDERREINEVVKKANKSCLKKQSCGVPKNHSRHVMFRLPADERVVVGGEGREIETCDRLVCTKQW